MSPQLALYYKNSYLKPNRSKTQVYTFHLSNKEAHGKLKVVWQGKKLEHSETPKYFGYPFGQNYRFSGTLSRGQRESMCKKKHHPKTNELKMGSTLRTLAFAVCFSTA